MAYIKCTFTLDAADRQVLADAAQREDTNVSEIVRRSIVLRDLLVASVETIAPQGRGRYTRIAVLPEGVPVPNGAEVVRLRLTGGLAAEGAPPSRLAARREPPPTTAPTPVPDRTVTFSECPECGASPGQAHAPLCLADEPELLLVHRRDDDADLDVDFTVDANGDPLPFTVRTLCGARVDATLATGDRTRVGCPRCLTEESP